MRDRLYIAAILTLSMLLLLALGALDPFSPSRNDQATWPRRYRIEVAGEHYYCTYWDWDGEDLVLSYCTDPVWKIRVVGASNVVILDGD